MLQDRAAYRRHMWFVVGVKIMVRVLRFTGEGDDAIAAWDSTYVAQLRSDCCFCGATSAYLDIIQAPRKNLAPVEKNRIAWTHLGLLNNAAAVPQIHVPHRAHSNDLLDLVSHFDETVVNIDVRGNHRLCGADQRGKRCHGSEREDQFPKRCDLRGVRNLWRGLLR